METENTDEFLIEEVFGHSLVFQAKKKNPRIFLIQFDEYIDEEEEELTDADNDDFNYDSVMIYLYVPHNLSRLSSHLFRC